MRNPEVAETLVAVAVGGARDAKWHNEETTLAALYAMALDAPEVGDKAEVGSMLGGALAVSPGPRRGDNIATRRLVTLDIDNPGEWTPEEFPHAAVAWETYSSTPEAPRYRVVALLDEDATPEDWPGVSAGVERTPGLAEVDATCKRWNQYMYLPARRPGCDIRAWDLTDRPVLSVFALTTLADAHEWVPSVEHIGDETTADPFTLPSWVGAFNRVYDDLDALVEEYALPYVAVGSRWKHTRSESEPGVIELEPGRWYSHHSSVDPAAGLSRTAFDLVRIHRFGDGPESHGHMEALARKDDAVREELGEVTAVATAGTQDRPTNLDDTRLMQWVMVTGLRGMWRRNPGLGWLQWDGKRWRPREQDLLVGAIRECMSDLLAAETQAGADSTRLKSLVGCLSKTKLTALAVLARGLPIVEDDDLDRHPHLLNVNNGVVDLRTGELLEHDPALMLTKITPVDYVPGAEHPDWDKALAAFTAPDTLAWFQRRMGQAATGEPPSDDRVPILQGGGSNGKSTIVSAIYRALGEHAVVVSDKILLGNAADHPVEMMPLRGARFAVAEETPEEGTLNTKRLKSLAGTDAITARGIRQAPITWTASHTLIVTTNHVPVVKTTDSGTWRRLALVPFTRTFNGKDRVRERLRNKAQQRAVLAWIVEGAKRCYDKGLGDLPAEVESATRKWRHETDLVQAFADDRLVFDPAGAVANSDLLDEFSKFLLTRSMRPWSHPEITRQLEAHEALRGVSRSRPRAVPPLSRPEGILEPLADRPRVWTGVRFLNGVEAESTPSGTEGNR